MSIASKIQILVELHGATFSLLIGLHLLFGKQRFYRGGLVLSYSIFCTMLLLLSDALVLFGDGMNTELGRLITRIAVPGVFVMEYLLIVLITIYISLNISHRNPNYSHVAQNIVFGLMGLDALMILLTFKFGYYYSFDEQNFYQRGPLFPMSLALAAIAVICIGWILWKNRSYLENTERIEIFVILLMPTCAAGLQVLTSKYSFIPVGSALSVFYIFAVHLKRVREANKKRELVLLQSQAYLLNSQIKPHFLFNSLNVIQSLIEEDPETAVMAVNHFSKFLRTGLKLEVMNHLVPIRTEMEYVDDYLYLEQLRHGKKIRVEREIEPGLDFEIPFLTIQPIVENAVRHGICKRIKGGTVKIEMRKEKEDFCIRVIDDGIGFVPKERERKEWDPSEMTASGVGMGNVKKRLAMMCSGTVEIQSEPGKGTTVTIRIPSSAPSIIIEDIRGSSKRGKAEQSKHENV